MLVFEVLWFKVSVSFFGTPCMILGCNQCCSNVFIGGNFDPWFYAVLPPLKLMLQNFSPLLLELGDVKTVIEPFLTV